MGIGPAETGQGGPIQMTSNQTRQIIRNAAADRDAKYRITRDGEVHFYGRMPNSIVTGWYFVGHSTDEVVERIQTGQC